MTTARLLVTERSGGRKVQDVFPYMFRFAYACRSLCTPVMLFLHLPASGACALGSLGVCLLALA